jgi:hypothetical protein
MEPNGGARSPRRTYCVLKPNRLRLATFVTASFTAALATVAPLSAAPALAPAAQQPGRTTASVAFEASHSATADEATALHPVTVVLSLRGGGRLARPLTVEVATGSTAQAPATATAGTDFAGVRQRLVFPRGSKDGATRTVFVPIQDDRLVEGDETLALQLANAVGGALGRTTAHVVTLTDDEHAEFDFATATSATADESTTAHAIAVLLDGTPGAALANDIYVDVERVRGSATPGADFTLATTTLLFPAGSPIGATVDATLDVLDDGNSEGDETVGLTLRDPSAPAVLGTARTHVLTITDDDFGPAPTVLGSARFLDVDSSGTANAGDRVVVPFTDPVTVGSSATDALALLVAGDTFGNGATLSAGPAANEVTITLGIDTTLKARHDFDPQSLGANAATGIDVAPNMASGAIAAVGGSDAAASSALDLVAGWVNTGQALGSFDARAITVGDVDGDGDQDAVIGNLDAPNTVWTNDGHGVLTDSGQLLGFSATRDVELGDVDLDGDLDLVVGNDAQPDEVWLNDGAGIFTDSGQALGASNTTGIALCDFDADGDLDLVVANSLQANTIWFNSGGTFTFSGQAFGANTTNAVALADVDRDGDTDVIFGNFIEDTTLYLNDGAGFFTDSTQGLHGRSLAILAGDIDADGDVDILRARDGANTVWVNDGTGLFDFPGQILGTDMSNGAVLADLDGDGDLDLASADDWGSDHVYWNDGAGTFTDSGLDFGYDDSSAMAAGDMDGDGDADLVVASRTGGCRVHHASLAGVWGSATYEDGGQALANGIERDLATGDLDGDGDVDLVLAIDGANEVWTNAAGAFANSGQALGSATTTCVRLGDLDGDGDLDLVAGNDLAGDRVWFNDGSGVFADSGQSLGTAATSAIALGDLDRDGDLDLVVAAAGGQPDAIWWNDGNGLFTDSGQMWGAVDSRGVELGDVDRDGDLDIAIAVHGGGDLVWLNDGSGLFTDSGQSLGLSDTARLTLGDVDRDGDLDLIELFDVSATSDARLWLNDGSGQFTDSGHTIGAGGATSFVLADVDGDRVLDLIVADASGENLWLGDGSGGFGAATSIDSPPNTVVGLALADIDRDGDLDLLSARDGSPDRVLLNR